MFELPEMTVLAGQINQTLTGKIIRRGTLGNSPHKYVWYNRKPAEFETLTHGKRIGAARVKGRWMLIALEPGYTLVLGECGGKMFFHPAGEPLPKKYHLLLGFEDGSSFSVMTQMWGAMELYRSGEERNRQYLRDMRPTPTDPEFTPGYFSALIDESAQTERRSAKGLLTQAQLIPGLGNAIAQDILFRAKLDPRHAADELTKTERKRLYQSIVKTVAEVTRRGGRQDEFDLFGKPGGYRRILDKAAAGHPCPKCSRKIVKLQYLGGACYFCPHCQK